MIINSVNGLGPISSDTTTTSKISLGVVHVVGSRPIHEGVGHVQYIERSDFRLNLHMLKILLHEIACNFVTQVTRTINFRVA